MSNSVNIDSKGYGKIYKAVMRNHPAADRQVCSYAGNSEKAFPKRDKIARDMCVNKDTFTKHLSTLHLHQAISREPVEWLAAY